MKHSTSLKNILIPLAVTLLAITGLRADLIISEFVASNDGSFLDEDGAPSDWIEIKNNAATPVDLNGWKLSDDVEIPTKWSFPAEILQPGEHLIVFASGKNRAVAAAELHTNFSLSKSGEYLALIAPDGAVASEFSPSYPPQESGYSYGSSTPSSSVVLITENDACNALVPNANFNTLHGTTWRNHTGFDDSSWAAGIQGVGYERSSGFQGDINLDVESILYNQNTSIYVRIPITASIVPANIVSLTLRMKYDDGFGAFINGAPPEDGSSYAPAPLAWNSTTSGGNNPEAAATVFEDFDVSDTIPSLVSGTGNVLAIHGLNATLGSSDALFRAELVAQVAQPGEASTGFITPPSPGAVNAGATYVGLLTDTGFAFGRGHYSAPFTETVTCPDLGATIIYTTDGSAPSPINGTQIPSADAGSSPTVDIPITTTTVLRAMAVKTDHEPTNIDTQSYLFLDDVLTQDGTGLPTPSTSTSTWDYEMDPAVVDDPRYANLVEDLKSLPTLSIAMSNDDVWGNNGVYANPKSFGSAWERGCSVEVIHPDGSPGYQVDGGLKIQGSGSRNRAIGKKSMRLVFRKEYGPSRFKYPLWGATGPDEVATISLRGSYFDSWTFQSDGGSADGITRRNALQFRTHFATVAHSLTGNHTIATNWVHLYINGQYWGPYNTHERPDGEFAEYHLGGDEDDYTVIKTKNELVQGSPTKWAELMALCNPYNPANYQAILDRIEVDQFIDYIFMNIWGGNNDWPHNNWYVIRNDLSGGPFLCYVWDPENYVYSTSADRSDVGGDSDENNSPGRIYDRLRRHPEFQVRFGDHVHKHMFNNGVYTLANMQALWQSIADELQPAMNCESARWGDEHTSSPYNTIDHWLPHVAYRKNTYMPTRHNLVLDQLRSRDLYPDTDAPVFSQHGGMIAPGYQLTMSNPNGSGTVYYTLDGSDPRLAGNGVSGTALTYSSAVPLPGSLTVKSRARSTTGDWSALNVASFSTGITPDLSNLVISEIHYHPADATPSEQAAGFTDRDDFEFIELTNTGPADLDLSSLAFVGGITFDFSQLASPLLPPGDQFVLVKNSAAFSERYGGGITIGGVYSGRLSNDGEMLTLFESGVSLLTFAYNDARPWPASADGQGASLVLIDPSANPDHSLHASWRASGAFSGTPGSTATLPPLPLDPLADSDGNGQADLIDYALVGALQSGLTTVGQDDFLSIEFTVDPRADAATIAVEQSEDLALWSSASNQVAFVSESYNTDGTVTYVWRSLTSESAAPRQFVRLAVKER